MKSGKIWGETKLLHANGVLEFHRIETVKGGVCSKHKHEFKWNGFFVESGKLLIRVWKGDYNLVDETILEPGDFTQVKPGEFHQFEALEDTVAFELYWAEFNHNDIVRETVGYTEQTIEDENIVLGNLTTMMGTITPSTTSAELPSTLTIDIEKLHKKQPSWHEDKPSKLNEETTDWHGIPGGA